MSAEGDQTQELQQQTNASANGDRSDSPPSGGVELPFVSNSETMGQSSPPHNYRHSRAYRHFKNPPQPHMCIRVTTVAGDELFINVLSWTRIVIPQEPSDPIPLYGGMKVPPGSPRCPPLVYAVMANPEVLKDSGRHSKDPEERRAMIELMCDFVEAMNPDVKLTRNAVILKDRDISGELKDVWNAVQAQRDREREEQISQQHYHTGPPQQMFLPQKQQSPQHQSTPCGTNGATAEVAPDNKVLYMEFGPESAPVYPQADQTTNSAQQSGVEEMSLDNNPPTTVAQSAINNSGNNFNSLNEIRKPTEGSDTADANCIDLTDSKSIKNGAADLQHTSLVINNVVNNSFEQNDSTSPAATESQTLPTAITAANTSPAATTITNSPSITVSTVAVTPTVQTAATTATTTTTTTTTTTKKDKLAGFLPNGCIFPRFKNNKHKDKEKEKDSSKSTANHSSKEKTLLNSLKKTTTAATNAFNKSQPQQNDDSSSAKSHYDKNCHNLEAEVEKLDLNKMNTSHGNNDVLIKLKVATSGAK